MYYCLYETMYKNNVYVYVCVCDYTSAGVVQNVSTYVNWTEVNEM